MVDILTLAGGGLPTLQRLLKSMDKHLKNGDYRHIIFCQGVQEVQDYLTSLEHDDRIYTIYSPVNLKISVAYNHLLEFSNMLSPASEYIFVLDDDFELKDDVLTKLMAFKKQHGFDVVAMEHSWHCGYPVPVDFSAELCGGGTLLFKRPIFNKLGYIDEQFWAEWDTDYTRRMTLCHGMRLGIAKGSDAWAVHYEHTGIRRFGQAKYRELQRECADKLKAKWTKQFARQPISNKVLEELRALDPLTRECTLSGAGLIVKCKDGTYRT